MSSISDSECIHNYVYVAESMENVCCFCGIVESSNHNSNSDKEELEIAIETKEESGFDLVEENNNEQDKDKNEGEEKKFNSINRNVLINKATEIDFSNGGFLSTKIDSRNVDSQGRHTDRSYTNKLKYNHNYILSSMGIQATYKNSIWRISSFADRLGLPIFVQERAAEVFRKMYHSKANIHNSNNMVCACLYYACKEARINKKLDDIAEVARTSKEDKKVAKKFFRKSVFLCYQSIVFSLGLNVPKYFGIEDDILYVGNKIGLPETTIRYAIFMLRDIKSQERMFFAGKSYELTAAILLYISALIHSDFLKSGLELSEFCENVGTGISIYILKKRADEYLKHPFFMKYLEKKQEKEIII